jgi:hypothetical protein
MADNIRIMQKALEKELKNRSANPTSEPMPERKGLLAPSNNVMSTKPDNTGNAPKQKNMQRVLADYIYNIRKQKEELIRK